MWACGWLLCEGLVRLLCSGDLLRLSALGRLIENLTGLARLGYAARPDRSVL
ncbi:hypothetical protein [Thermogemmatispora sp.]|uniref:hypothetical protein n=1 Tax=Thermogemmatispora sp. TaxID=1968838 RepID=UPI0035E3FF0C